MAVPTLLPPVQRGLAAAKREDAVSSKKPLGKVCSPIQLDTLALLLQAYPSIQDAIYLEEGFWYSFRIPYDGARISKFSNNLKSVVGLELVVFDKIVKEPQEGRVAGSFDTPPMLTLRISPLGVVPKKIMGEYRLIHHLSYPHGDSVNDGIPSELVSVHYTSFDSAVNMVAQVGGVL